MNDSEVQWVHEEGYGSVTGFFDMIVGTVMLVVGLVQLVVTLFRGARG